jgi:outer membrane protein assembly factor BamB
MVTTTRTDNPTPRKRLRLWPGVVAVVALWLARFGLKAVIPGFAGFQLGMMWGFGGVAAVLGWWLFFSRARWAERVGVLVLMVLALAGTWQVRHASMGPLWLVGYAVPILCLALVAGAVASRRLADGPRRATMAAAIVLACGGWTLVRTEGISGDHVAQFHWRWAKSSEERLQSQARPEPVAPPPAPLEAETTDKGFAAPVRDKPVALSSAPAALKTGADWPGFRGPQRDGISRGVRIETDWSASPPVELWRQPIGPGWSSFAVRGDRLYTQEQRGDDEAVSCHEVTTGAPVWTHRDAARFFESNAGPGPRGTPTLSGGRVYALGATGVLNALDADDGALVWSRNAAADAGAEVPTWGFSSSPLVIGKLVIVAASGTLVAYDLDTGQQRWLGPARGESYSSPHLMMIGGVAQIVHMSGSGAAGVAPADGTLLWEHAWKGFPIVQPALTADGDVLITASGESGLRRIAVGRASGGWTVEKRWGSSDLKPYFNDFVVHEGHGFGFDGRILACIDLKDGKRKWKGGRFGNGQLLLLPDQDLLLVLSEEGELALVKATADQFTELARFPAIKGKTWNHPVVVGDVLLVRNGEEMAAFRLPHAGI